MRRLLLAGLLLAATVVGVSVASAKPRHRPAVIRLYVPAPGHVTVEIAKVHVAGKNAAKFKLPRRFRVANGAAYKGAVAMVAGKLQRRRNAATITLIAVVVNGGSSAGRSLAALGSAPAAARLVAGPPPEIKVGDGQSTDWELEFAAAATASGLASEQGTTLLLGSVITGRFAALVNADAAAPADASAFAGDAGKIFKSPDPYDPTQTAPAFGWKRDDVKGAQDGLKLATAPPADIPDLVRDLFGDAGVAQPLFRYGFSGLSATIDPGAGGLPAFTETFSGAACGADARTAPWSITISIPPDAPQTIPGFDFGGGGAVNVVTNTVRQNGNEVGSATSSLQVVPHLLLSPSMVLNVTTTGTERATSGVPASATISATPATGC